MMYVDWEVIGACFVFVIASIMIVLTTAVVMAGLVSVLRSLGVPI